VTRSTPHDLVADSGFESDTAGWNTVSSRVSISYTAAAPGSSNLDLNVCIPSAEVPPGSCFNADDVLVTVG
jgi:hypothetical protein